MAGGAMVMRGMSGTPSPGGAFRGGDDAGILSTLKQLRHDYEVLLAEKRDTEQYCEELERESHEKTELIALSQEAVAKHLKTSAAYKDRVSELEEELASEREVVAELRRGAAAGAAAVEAARVFLDADGTLCGPDSSVYELREEIHRVEATIEKLYSLLRDAVKKERGDTALSADGSRSGGWREGSEEGGDGAHAATKSKLGRPGDSGVCGSDHMTSFEEEDATASGESGHVPALALRAELEASVRAAGERLGDALRELDEAHERVGEWEALANELEAGLEAAHTQLESEAAARFELRDQLDELQAEVRHLREALAEAEARAEAAEVQARNRDNTEQALGSDEFHHHHHHHHHRAQPRAWGITNDDGNASSSAVEMTQAHVMMPRSSLADEIAAQNGHNDVGTGAAALEPPGGEHDGVDSDSDDARIVPPKAKHGLSVPGNLLDLVYGDGLSSPAAPHEFSVVSLGSVQNTPQAMRGPLLFGGHLGEPMAHSTPSTLTGGANGERALGVSPLLVTPLKDTHMTELSPIVDRSETAALSSPSSSSSSPAAATSAASKQASLAHNEWNSSNPSVAKRFVVMGYDFDALDRDRELQASKGETLKIVRGVVKEVWWFMENAQGAKGYVPRDYVTPKDPILAKAVGEVRKRVFGVESPQVEVWYARFDYAAKDEKQVSLVKGERVDVISRPPDKKWWVVRTISGNITGFAPCSYLEGRWQERAPPRPVLAAPLTLPTSSCAGNDDSNDNNANYNGDQNDADGAQSGESKPQARRQAVRKRMAWLTQKPSTATTGGGSGGGGAESGDHPDVDLLKGDSSTTSGGQKRGGMWKNLTAKGFASARTRQVLSSAKEKLLKNGQWFGK